MRDDEKQKSGSGKSPTKFMERPGSKSKDKKEPEQELSHPEFIEDDLDALESQEKGDAEYQGWNPPTPPKSEEKKDQRKSETPPRKFPESEKRDSSSDDVGDCACP